MNNKNTIETAKDAISLVGEVIKVAGDNPNIKGTANELGKTALTLTKTINHALLPLAAINFGFEKAREYFSTQFESDIEGKAKEIPKERLIEPKASVAGPALQGLAFSHDEESLRDMYLNLLASSMDSTTAEEAHPAFVEIIKQMSKDDAKIASIFIKGKIKHPIIEIRKRFKEGNSWDVMQEHVLSIISQPGNKPIEFANLSTIIDNLIRLGLINVSYNTFLNNEQLYDWANSRPELIKFKKEHNDDDSEIVFEKGVLQPTSLGRQFSKAVGIEISSPTT